MFNIPSWMAGNRVFKFAYHLFGSKTFFVGKGDPFEMLALQTCCFNHLYILISKGQIDLLHYCRITEVCYDLIDIISFRSFVGRRFKAKRLIQSDFNTVILTFSKRQK